MRAGLISVIILNVLFLVLFRQSHTSIKTSIGCSHYTPYIRTTIYRNPVHAFTAPEVVLAMVIEYSLLCVPLKWDSPQNCFDGSEEIQLAF